MKIRTITLAAVGVLGVGVAGVGVGAALSDPVRQVDAVRVPDVRVATTATSSTAPAPEAPTVTVASPSPEQTARPADTSGASEAVRGLEQLRGTVRIGDDRDDWYVNGVELDLGPEGWVLSAGPMGDFDGDGTDEALRLELDGLEGRTATFGVRYERDSDGDRDDAVVYTIEDRVYRDPDAAAPWAAGADGTSDVTADEAGARAVGAVGAGARVVDLDREDEGSWTGWDVEVRSADGREYQVLVDRSGRVLDVRADD